MTLTTAATAHPSTRPQNRVLLALVVLYAAVWIWAAIAPFSRSDWFLENLLVFAAIGTLAWLYRTRPLSDLSSIFLALFLALHTFGSHYTYSEVPLGFWMKDFFGFERNHYDRLVHFSFGLLLAYPLRELILRAGLTRPRWAAVFAFTIIAAASSLYEIMEWVVAAIVDPNSGAAFLGTQGDEFDSQKDEAMALVGSLVTLTITAVATAAGAKSISRTR